MRWLENETLIHTFLDLFWIICYSQNKTVCDNNSWVIRIFIRFTKQNISKLYSCM